MTPPPNEIVAAPSPKRLKLSADQTEEEEKKMTTPVESESDSDGSDHAIEPEYESDQEDEDISSYPDHIIAKFPNLTVEEGTLPLHDPIIISEEERRLFCPPENPRFQLCCFQVRFKNYNKRGKLFGTILASVDSLSPDPSADLASATLFHRELDDSLVVRNLSFVQHIYPTCDRSIPASTYLDIIPELHLITHEDGKDNPNFIEVANGYFSLDFLTSWLKGCYEGGNFVVLEGEHGSIKLYYVVIRHAVDAVLEVTFEAQPKLCLKSEYTVLITAYYGPDFKTYKSDSEKHSYKLKLFQSGPMALLTTGKIPLLQSVVAVPAKSSLVINTWIHNSRSWYTHMDHDHAFHAQLKNISDSACFEEEDCRLHVTVNWKYELAT